MDKLILDVLNIPMLIEADRFSGFIHAQRVMRSRADEKPRTRTLNIDGQAAIKMELGGGYVVTQSGIAIVGVFGPMFKGYGSWGYADQSEIRASVRQAANDPSVSAIMLLIDSPGGSVAGTADLFAEIKSADAIKPVMAYIEDCGCSAAYWTACGARSIYSNGGVVGSIGVVSAIVDSSKYFENAGVKVHPIVTGEMKAVGMDGVPVTPAQIQYVQSLIDSIYSDFVNAVASARGMRGESIRKMEAKVFVGDQPVENKLVDGVMSFDKAMSLLGKAAKQPQASKRARAVQMLAELAK